MGGKELFSHDSTLNSFFSKTCSNKMSWVNAKLPFGANTVEGKLNTLQFT